MTNQDFTAALSNKEEAEETNISMTVTKKEKIGGSLTNQLQQSYKAIDGVGQSKKEARKKGLKKVHSKKQQQENKSGANGFKEFLEREGIKNLRDLTPYHHHKYIEQKKNEGVSIGHLRNIETVLHFLQAGLNALEERKGLKLTTFYKGRLIRKVKNKYQDRSYTEEEYLTILKELKYPYNVGWFLGYCCGLRAKELANIRKEHFMKVEKQYIIHIKDGAGITKGGRPRMIIVDEEHTPFIDYFLKDIDDHEKVMKGKSDQDLRNRVLRIKKAKGMDYSDRRGLHGLRHSFARNRLQAIIEEEQDDESAAVYKKLKTHFREHKNLKVDWNEEEKNALKRLLVYADVVHAELGHGKGRNDLLKRYLL